MLEPRPGHPGPAVVNPGPAAVMRGREPPGHIVDPSPAPGCQPAPMAVAVGRPALRDHIRIPDLAVALGLFPDAICIERVVAGHLGGDEAQSLRSNRVAAGRAPPRDKLVARAGIQLRGDRSAAVQNHHRSGSDGCIDAGRDHAGAAVQRGDAGGRLVVACRDIVIARPVGIETREMNADPALRPRDLRRAFVKPADLDPGCRRQGDHVGTDAQPDAGLVAGSHRHAGGDRIVGGRIGGLPGRRANRDGAVDSAYPADPGRRGIVGTHPVKAGQTKE